MNELKPCPFCGGEASVASDHLPFQEENEVFHVYCDGAFCGMNPCTNGEVTPCEAAAVWNQRNE